MTVRYCQRGSIAKEPVCCVRNSRHALVCVVVRFGVVPTVPALIVMIGEPYHYANKSMTAVPHATDGLFCDTATLTVANGQVWDGLFCDVDVIIPTPPRGGGGTGAGPGDYYNQAPDTRRKTDEPLLLAQARQEDEELIILLKAFAEVIQWH